MSARRRSMFGWVVIFGLAGACSSAELPVLPDTRSDAETAEARARAKLEHLRAHVRGVRVVLEGVARHADGRFGHLRVRYSRPATLTERFAIDGRGDVLDRDEAERRFAGEHRAQWGAFGLETAARIVQAGPANPRSLMIWYDRAQLAEERVFHRVRALDPAAEVRARPDVAFLRAAPGVVRNEIADDLWVRRITDAEPMEAIANSVSGAHAVPNSATSSWSKEAFNDQGNTAKEVKVGTTEIASNNASPSCGIWAGLDNAMPPELDTAKAHEAFKELSGIHYHDPALRACNDDSACTECNQTIASGVLPGVCRDGFCVAQHATQTASRIASAQSSCTGSSCQDGAWHAAGVDLFIENLEPVTVADGLRDSYEWFSSSGVRIVNESWGPLGPSQFLPEHSFTYRDLMGDWFARHESITFVRSAGNNFDLEYDDEEGVGAEPTGCYSFNTVCVGSFRYDGTAASPAMMTFEYDTTTGWNNPFGDEPSFELEKPDVMAHGERAHVAYTGAGSTQTSWTQDTRGTSYASPVVAGLLALLTHHCSPMDKTPFSPALNRAILRTSGDWFNEAVALEETMLIAHSTCPSTTRPLYPTADAQFGCDYHAGTGPVDARKLRIWCGSGGDEPPGYPTGHQTGSGTTHPGNGTAISNYPGLETATANHFEYTGGLSPPDNTRMQPGATVVPLFSWTNIQNTNRIRGTFSYYSCPESPSATEARLESSYTGVNDLTLAANFDLALCGVTMSGSPSCVFVSEGGNESNEGFDVTFTSAWSSVEMLLIQPERWTPCGGDSNEPYGWAVVWWQ